MCQRTAQDTNVIKWPTKRVCFKPKCQATWLVGHDFFNFFIFIFCESPHDRHAYQMSRCRIRQAAFWKTCSPRCSGVFRIGGSGMCKINRVNSTSGSANMTADAAAQERSSRAEPSGSGPASPGWLRITWKAHRKKKKKEKHPAFISNGKRQLGKVVCLKIIFYYYFWRGFNLVAIRQN